MIEEHTAVFKTKSHEGGPAQALACTGNVLICLERGCVADQPQRCDWCFAHSRAPKNLNENTVLCLNRIGEHFAPNFISFACGNPFSHFTAPPFASRQVAALLRDRQTHVARIIEDTPA